MNTPIYEALKAEQHKEAAQIAWPPVGTLIITKPEPRWKTFLRSLGWWKP